MGPAAWRSVSLEGKLQNQSDKDGTEKFLHDASNPFIVSRGCCHQSGSICQKKTQEETGNLLIYVPSRISKGRGPIDVFLLNGLR